MDCSAGSFLDPSASRTPRSHLSHECCTSLSLIYWMTSHYNNIMYVYIIYYESQPVGLAEVIDASEASLGGPGGRPSQMSKNRVK